MTEMLKFFFFESTTVLTYNMMTTHKKNESVFSSFGILIMCPMYLYMLCYAVEFETNQMLSLVRIECSIYIRLDILLL